MYSPMEWLLKSPTFLLKVPNSSPPTQMTGEHDMILLREREIQIWKDVCVVANLTEGWKKFYFE